MRARAHGPRRLNFLEVRATETELSPTNSALIAEATPDSTSQPVAAVPSVSRTAIVAAVSVVVALLILGLVVYKYRTRNRNNIRSAPSLAGKVIVEKEYHSEKRIDFNDVSIYTEKPPKAVLTPRSFDDQVGWVPQIKTYPSPNVPVPKVAASPKSKSKRAQLSVRTLTEDALEIARSPPPSYLASSGDTNFSPSMIPIPPFPAVPNNAHVPPPTPPANRKTKTSFSSLSEQPPMPALSPRHESFAPQDLGPSTDNASGDEMVKDQKLPRLMSVATTFSPTRDDELAIKIEDTVRMLEEYRDGWCLVQRVGRIDAPRGAVPRFCLQERRGVVPMVPTRKFSNGSIHSRSSTQGWR